MKDLEAMMPRRSVWMAKAGAIIGLVALVLVVRLVLCGSTVAEGASPQPSPPGGLAPGPPVRVRVGILLLSVGDIDIATSNSLMDMYLLFTCDRPCDPGNFEIMNGRTNLQDLQEQTPTYRVYRVQAQLRNNWDFHEYPFDRNALSVIIEDKIHDKTELVYESDPARSGIDRNVVIAGWNLAPRWTATAVDHDYPVFQETYSRYTFQTAIERPLIVGLLALFPALILVGVGLLSFVLGVELEVQRLTVSTSALVATVLFHFTLRSSLPPVGYFTFADRFMIIGYIVLAGTIAISIVLLNLVHAKREAEAERLRRMAGRTIPAVWIVLQALNVAMLLPGTG